MPLLERVRIEVYLPDLPKRTYQDLVTALDREFTFTFGGCTVIRGLDGSYLSQAGRMMQDKINIIYTDIPLALSRNLSRISSYTEHLSKAAYDALEEEAVLIAAFTVLHSNYQ